ncbi:hypothetical protein E4U46_000783 [Claviceps purpurea]|nr:hypothetical protein E4U12_004930 [Claviceps purpurea]KAG6291771.1 hypothetical protein E4U46_000783 [Claviceps purpurea]
MGRTSYEQAGMARFEIPRSRLIEQADDKGVLHRDVGWENVLFNPETKGVMVIDFERADLLDKSTSARQDAAGELETPEKTTQQLRAAPDKSEIRLAPPPLLREKGYALGTLQKGNATHPVLT